MDALMDYPWPGNVRELENAVERAVVLCRGDTIQLVELPPAIRGVGDQPPQITDELPPDGLDFRTAVQDYQARLLTKALERSGGVQRKAAKLLGLSPTTLNEMVHRLGLQDIGSDD
jgi:DNA-binding NtrC family response regulator